MKIGWLADDPGYIGGAERTQAEFRLAAPKGVGVVSCPAGHVVENLDRYVIHNHRSYHDLPEGPRFFYHHDTRPLTGDGTHIFCSPLLREKLDPYDNTSPCIPPALDLEVFRQVGQAHSLMQEERKGAVWVGMHPNHPGKGLDFAIEWARGNGGLDIYGNGAPNGLVKQEDIPRLLARYRTFVHLPRALEPFGRSVVEAWAAGCELVINRKVGARYWIEEKPKALQTAAKDFWAVVCG
jgi:glycosyltransferase involved in cell wall biosynthesis